MEQIPKEVFYIIGTLIVTKSDVIIGFIKSKIKDEVRVSTLETKMDSLTISIGKLEAKLETYQKDLNNYFEKLRKSA